MKRTSAHINKAWQQLVKELPWGGRHAKQSARLALSKAQWLGIEKNTAIQAIFEARTSEFLRANRHILFEAWQTVTNEIAQPNWRELLST